MTKGAFLKASTDFDALVSEAESSMRELEFDYIQNRTKELVEFEVSSPAYFRLVIETRKDPEVHNFILPSISKAKGCTIDIRFDLDSGVQERFEAGQLASKLMRTLVEKLNPKPWDGLRFREAGREHKRWKEIITSGPAADS